MLGAFLGKNSPPSPHSRETLSIPSVGSLRDPSPIPARNCCGFPAAFPPFQAKRPWGPVGWGWGFRWVFSRISTPLRASVGFGKGKAWPMVPSCGAALCGSSGAAGEPPGLDSRGVPPVSPPPAWQALGWPQPLVLGWAARARRDGVVPGEPVRVGTLGWAPLGPQASSPSLVAWAPSRGQRVSFLSQLGRAGSPPAFLFVFHPAAPRQPGPRPSKPREPHPALWDGAGLGGQLRPRSSCPLGAMWAGEGMGEWLG